MSEKLPTIDEVINELKSEMETSTGESWIQNNIKPKLEKLMAAERAEELSHLDRHATWYPDGSEPIEVQRRIAQLTHQAQAGGEDEE